ncbi:MAG: DedA family protein, partial [Candidatus Pacebacteria bacterium]|nr:DedA family protein [Candidatus Paceibacterota bacterium]
MHELFDITGLISSYGYVGIFIIVFLESGIFFALPGDSLLFTAGMVASAHVLSIYKLIPLIFISTFTGALVGYEIGLRLDALQKYR